MPRARLHAPAHRALLRCAGSGHHALGANGARSSAALLGWAVLFREAHSTIKPTDVLLQAAHSLIWSADMLLQAAHSTIWPADMLLQAMHFPITSTADVFRMDCLHRYCSTIRAAAGPSKRECQTWTHAFLTTSATKLNLSTHGPCPLLSGNRLCMWGARIKKSRSRGAISLATCIAHNCLHQYSHTFTHAGERAAYLVLSPLESVAGQNACERAGDRCQPSLLTAAAVAAVHLTWMRSVGGGTAAAAADAAAVLGWRDAAERWSCSGGPACKPSLTSVLSNPVHMHGRMLSTENKARTERRQHLAPGARNRPVRPSCRPARPLPTLRFWLAGTAVWARQVP